MDITGQKFNKLTAIEYRGNCKWLFRCECGSEAVINGSRVRQGLTKSCGCSLIGNKHNLKHGHHGTSIFNIHKNMRYRCYNPNNTMYANYGGRGIKVCDRWLGEHGFENFLADMGERPGKEYSLDRIDVNGDYCPENCRWATQKEQQNNRRSNRNLTHNGQTHTIEEWSELTKIHPSTIWHRLNDGWTVERALTTADGRERGRKLADDEVRYVRKSDKSVAELVAYFNGRVSHRVIFAIIRGETYKNVI